MPNLLYFQLLFLVFLSSAAISQDFTTLSTVNQVFNPKIRTVLLFPGNDEQEGAVLPAAVPLSYSYPLILKFDEVNVEEAFTYNAKIVHCDAGWNASALREMQYLYDFNEFNIDNYEFSTNRVVPYTHYTFTVPKVKIPGNYLLVVYKDFNPDDIAFVQRFYVYDQKIGISAGKSIIGSAINDDDQLVEFTVDYSNYPVLNPLQEIKVAVRQNDRWDNVIANIQPTIFRDDLKQLVYRNYANNESFKAGNEFRFFDLTSVRYNMRNVDRIAETEHRIDAYLAKDRFRGYEPYTMIRDLNGGFYIENKDYGNHHIDAEYVNTHFFLELPPEIRDDIYIGGKLAGWQASENNKMKYVKETNTYTCTLLLKQGLYDYQYLVPGYPKNPNIVEGNHYETGNFYEILVYYSHPVFRTDILLGYYSFISN